MKITVSHLLQSVATFRGKRSFIVVFASTRHLTISWARWIQATPFNPIALKSILILSTILSLVFSKIFLPVFCNHFWSPVYQLGTVVWDIFAGSSFHLLWGLPLCIFVSSIPTLILYSLTNLHLRRLYKC